MKSRSISAINKQRRATSSNKPRSQDHSLFDQRKGERWPHLLILAVVGALAIVGFYMVLVPPPEDVPSEIVANTPLAPGLLPSSVPDGESAVLTTVEEAADGLNLPIEPRQVQAEVLQKELEELAVFLADHYSGEPGAHHFAAQIWDALHQSQRAEEQWRLALRHLPQVPGPYAGLADLLVQTGRETEAVAILRQAHERGIHSIESVLTLARALEGLGELNAARTVLVQSADEYDGEAAWHEALGRVLNQLGEYASAEESLRRAMQLGGESEARLFLLITVLTRQQKRDEARQASRRLQDLKSSRKDTAVPSGFQAGYEATLERIAHYEFMSAALLASEKGDFDVAQRFFRKTLELQPGDAQALMELGTLFRRQGDLPKAIAVHQRLVEVQPDNVFNHTNLASLWLQVGHPDKARATLLAGVTADPTGVVAQAALARLAVAEGRIDAAKKWASEVLERNRSVESYVLLASVYQASGQHDQAQALLSEAKQLDPSHPLLQGRP